MSSLQQLDESQILNKLLEWEQPPWAELKDHPAFQPRWAAHFLRRRKIVTLEEIQAIYQDPDLRKDYRVRCAMCGAHRTPLSIQMTLMPSIRWADLMQLLRLPLLTGPSRQAIDAYLQEKYPQLTLGEKISFARKATRSLIPLLRVQPEGSVLNALFHNPYFTFDDALFMASSPKVPARSLFALAQNPKWNRNREIRLALLSNPKLPNSAVPGLVKTLSPFECQNLLQSPRLTLFVRRVLERLSPSSQTGRT
ncbi:MAG: hypothetical protein KDC71_01695 [Acidobacteria bacterium]|nr:hypothetical protein [Acidobacteriota bacterium]